MKLIIDIPEDVYTRLFDNGIQDNEIAVDDVCEMARALRMGMPYEERPKGEWLSLSDVSSSGFGTWVCSQCGQGFRGIKSKMPYCTCGADMRGDGNV